MKTKTTLSKAPGLCTRLSLSFTQEGAAERNQSCLAWMSFSCCQVTRSSKTFIWTSLMKTTTHSTQMASFKHEASNSHNKCGTAWKRVLFLPETVEIQIVCIEVQERLRGVAGTVRLQHGGAGWNDGGLAWGMDCFELELGAHPQTSVRPSVSHYFDLWEHGEMLNKTQQYTEWFLQYTEPPEACCVLCHQVRGTLKKGQFGMSLLEKGRSNQSKSFLWSLESPRSTSLGTSHRSS